MFPVMYDVSVSQLSLTRALLAHSEVEVSCGLVSPVIGPQLPHGQVMLRRWISETLAQEENVPPVNAAWMCPQDGWHIQWDPLRKQKKKINISTSPTSSCSLSR